MLTKSEARDLQRKLQTKRFGRKIFFAESVSSTNDWAKELARSGAEEGTIAVAQTQTAGRGRLNREWISPEGGLWFSLILRPRIPPKEAMSLVFVASLAVADTLRKHYRLKVETKWPNDVLVSERKVCGILTETEITGEKINYAVIGIGLNAKSYVDQAFPAELKKTATSIEKEIERRVRIGVLFKVLVQELETLYDLMLVEGPAPILARWKKYASFLGVQVEVKDHLATLSGIAYDIGNDGTLLLELAHGAIKKIPVGDITLCTKQAEVS